MGTDENVDVFLLELKKDAAYNEKIQNVFFSPFKTHQWTGKSIN